MKELLNCLFYQEGLDVFVTTSYKNYKDENKKKTISLEDFVSFIL